MRTLIPQFSMQRMLKDYMTDYYLPGLNGEKAKR
jgi:hypothetical protein